MAETPLFVHDPYSFRGWKEVTSPSRRASHGSCASLDSLDSVSQLSDEGQSCASPVPSRLAPVPQNTALPSSRKARFETPGLSPNGKPHPLVSVRTPPQQEPFFPATATPTPLFIPFPVLVPCFMQAPILPLPRPCLSILPTAPPPLNVGAKPTPPSVPSNVQPSLSVQPPQQQPPTSVVQFANNCQCTHFGRWKRLRIKKGLNHMLCHECGAKWKS